MYLLQKAADQIISKKLNLYDENTCIREIDTLINMFIILYNNSNIDYNKNVESKIYNLYINIILINYKILKIIYYIRNYKRV